MEKVTSVVALLLLVVVAVSRGQDGCPPLAAGTIGLCVEECKGDDDCSPGEKCCSNGCGHECKAIVDRCRPVTCDKPGCHVVKDENNCDVCKCDKPTPSCDDTKCPEGYRCVLQQVECIRAPCPPVPQCVGIKQLCNNSEPLLTATGETYFCGRGGNPCPDGYNCHIDPADRFAVCCPNTTACSPVRCAPECRVKKNKNGCEVCDCDDACPLPLCFGLCKLRRGNGGCLECDCDNPCPRIACAPWCRQKKDERGCVVCDCSKRCPPVFCRLDCRLIKDKRGCDACDCQNPCQNVHCKDGQVCEIKTMPCFWPPCPEQAVCVDKPTCSPVRCSPPCRAKKGPDGCNFCDCPPPCHDCRPDQTCEVFYPPCRPEEQRCPPPVGICKGKPTCPPVRCARECRTKKGPDGCDVCDCPEPCHNVHCKDGQVCEVKTMPCIWPPCPEQAVCVDKPTCPPVRCSPPCHRKKGPDGCDFCDCAPPCQDCRPDQKCEVFYPLCRPEQMVCPPPVGECTDLLPPPPPPSDKRCMTKPRLTPCFFSSPYRYVYDVDTGRCRRLGRHTCSLSRNRFRTISECEACRVIPEMLGPPEPISGGPYDRRAVSGRDSLKPRTGTSG